MRCVRRERYLGRVHGWRWALGHSRTAGRARKERQERYCRTENSEPDPLLPFSRVLPQTSQILSEIHPNLSPNSDELCLDKLHLINRRFLMIHSFASFSIWWNIFPSCIYTDCTPESFERTASILTKPCTLTPRDGSVPRQCSSKKNATSEMRKVRKKY